MAAFQGRCGAVAEWSKALAWKVSIRQNRIEGSNPSRSANINIMPWLLTARPAVKLALAESRLVPHRWRMTMAKAATPFITEKSSGDLLNWADKKRFQQLFATQAVKSYVYLSLGMGIVAAALPVALLLAGGYEGHYSISTF